MYSIDIPFYFLVTPNSSESSQTSQEVVETLRVTFDTTVGQVLNTLVSKLVQPSQVQFYSLYETEIHLDTKVRTFVRSLEPDERILVLMHHHFYYKPTKNILFYIKKREKSENSSIYADLRREHLRLLPLDLLLKRKELLDKEEQKQRERIMARHQAQILDIKHRMHLLGYNVIKDSIS